MLKSLYKSMVQIKRIYDTPSKNDGKRILVDRLWPRGTSKEKAALDGWMKDVAPSPGLRTWFGHKPERFEEFTARYTAELDDNPSIEELRNIIKNSPDTTLLYAARDPKINHDRACYWTI
jgi:uncharacterized protein YeaO (DUF488 family)